MPGTKSQRFAGLPGADAPVESYEDSWTLPKKHLSRRWAKSQFGDADRTFTFQELTPERQHAAAKVSGSNPSVLQQELIFRSLVKIGTRDVRKDLDCKTAWWSAIGPRCRVLVTTAFGEMASVGEEDLKSFLDGEDDEDNAEDTTSSK